MLGLTERCMVVVILLRKTDGSHFGHVEGAVNEQAMASVSYLSAASVRACESVRACAHWWQFESPNEGALFMEECAALN